MQSELEHANSELEGAHAAAAEVQSELDQVKDEYEQAKNEHQNSIDAVYSELQSATDANAELQVRVIQMTKALLSTVIVLVLLVYRVLST